jgi:hypothetical protein
MIVSIVSLGSKWMEPRRRGNRHTVMLNTTGLVDGGKLRCRSKVHGSVRFLRRELAAVIDIAGSRWETDGIAEWQGGHRLALRGCVRGNPERYLVTVTDTEVGRMSDGVSWNVDEVELISMSEGRSGQEVMLLMSPFAWVRGERCVLHLTVSPHDLRGKLQQL